MSTWPKLFETVKSMEWREHIRPLSEFVDSQRFGRLRTSVEMQARATLNLHHFMINYILLFGLVLIFACALRPLLLFGILAGAALFFLVSGREVITIPGFPEGRNQLKGQAKHGASVGICLFVLLLFAGPSVFAVVGFSACLIGLHAVFYIPDPEAMHEEIETEKQMELP